MPTTRNHSFDLLKTLAIFMVCSYHFSALGALTNTTLILRATHSICVPLFFFINGALLFARPYDGIAHLKKCLQILLQFFAWKFITLVAIASIHQINLLEIGWIHVLNAVFFFANLPGVDMAHLWFIPVLISLYCLFPFFKLMFDRLHEREHRIVYFTCIAFLTVVSMLCRDGDVFKSFFPYLKVLNIAALSNFSPFQGLIASMLVYFLLGGIVQKWLPKLQAIKTLPLLLCYLLGLASLLFQHYTTTTLLGLPEYDITFAGYDTISTTLMVCSLFLLANKISVNVYRKLAPFLTPISQNTLGIYYLHWILGTAFASHLLWALAAYHGVAFNTVRSLLTLLLCVLIAQGIKKIPVLKKLL